MKSKKASLRKIPIFLTSITSILSLALILLFAAHALAIVNLEVPIEMIDRGISSIDTGNIKFKRSMVSLNEADYDGDTYYFEIVAKNTNTTTAYSVYLRDMTNAVDKTSYLVPANTTSPTRFRTTSPFVPVDNTDIEYRVKLPQTAAADQLVVYAARIIVVQANATKTRIQIPLLNHGYNGLSHGTGAGSDNTSSTAYTQSSPVRYSLWQKDVSAWGDIPVPPATPWTFEAVARTTSATETSYVSLFNYTDNTQVTVTEHGATGGTGFQLMTADFASDATNFDDSDEFEVRHYITNGTYVSALSRAALYVRLTNLNKGEVYWRFSRKISSSANNTNGCQRILLDTSKYTSPEIYNESTGWESILGDITLKVFDAGTSDSSKTGSAVSNSDINFNSGVRGRQRTTTDLIPYVTSGNRYIRNIVWTSGTIDVASCWLVVKFADYAGGSLEVCKSGCPYSVIQNAVNAAITGDTVTVTDGGTYNEQTLQMKTGVDVVSTWIQGVDPPGDRPLITRNSGGQNVVFGSGVSNCKLKGFRIQAVGSCSMLGTVYFVGNNSGITIEDCEVYDESVGCGILMYGRVSATIRRCTVRDNDAVGISGYRMGAHWTGGTVVIEDTEVYNNGYWTGMGGCAGIMLYDADTLNYPSQVTITNNCYVHDNYKAGIVLVYVSQATVENSTIENNGTGGTAGSGYGGIRIDDVGTATISNNVIKNHAAAAGICIVDNSNVTIGADLAASDPSAYANDIHSNYAGIYFRTANSEPVIIRGNDIYSNARGGIRVNAALTGQVTITQNSINNNTWGGISINNTCTATITKNNIYSSTNRGGIHTTGGSPTLTIRQNKVHHNQGATRGGGIDVRHASGIIENNLVYKNARGGIRFGDYITEIKNNTVVNNGNAAQDRGGGIIFDDLAGLINDPPAGIPPAPLLIRNNISAYNEKSGIRACFDNTGAERDYNLVYLNNGTTDDCGWYTSGGYSYVDNLRCANMQYGGCGAHVPPPLAMDDPHDIIDDPEFVPELDNYHLDNGSPAKTGGEGGVEMGAYGGGDPLVDSEIPEL